MSKTVIDCGNCNPDHAAIRGLLEGAFGAEVVRTHGAEDTLERLRQGPADLVLVNRKLDRDYTDGIDVVRQIKSDPTMRDTPVMLVTNHADHQQQAVSEGAEPGFGKLALHTPETHQLLAKFLENA